MTTTLAELRSDVRNEIKIDPNGKIWGDAVMNDYINEAYLKLQSDGFFRWPANENGSGTISLTAATQEYALPSDFGILDLAMLSTTRLFQTDFFTAKIRNATNAQSTPTHYYIRGANMGFDPIPNASNTVNLYYRKILATLSTDASLMLFADNFAPAVVKYAAYLVWSSPRGNKATALEKLDDYIQKLRTLMSFNLLRDNAVLEYGVRRSAPYNIYPDRL